MTAKNTLLLPFLFLNLLTAYSSHFSYLLVWRRVVTQWCSTGFASEKSWVQSLGSAGEDWNPQESQPVRAGYKELVRATDSFLCSPLPHTMRPMIFPKVEMNYWIYQTLGRQHEGSGPGKLSASFHNLPRPWLEALSGVAGSALEVTRILPPNAKCASISFLSCLLFSRKGSSSFVNILVMMQKDNTVPALILPPYASSGEKDKV